MRDARECSAGHHGARRRCAGGADRLISAVKLDHLYRLTDSTGIWQHARGRRPNPEFGYCVDDNARALIVAIRALALTGQASLIDYVRHYLAFVERCQRADGRFHNFLSADGQWLDEVGSDDANGRAIWALGFAARYSAQAEVRLRALGCLDKALPGLETPSHWLRAQAFTLLGLAHWRQAEPSPALDALVQAYAAPLLAAYEATARPDWRWFEDELTYSNARLPEALLAAGHLEPAIESLCWLCSLLVEGDRLSLIGNRGWYRRGGERAIVDQQAVDACALVSACVAAYRATGDQRFRKWAELGGAWFQGANPLGVTMLDPDSGGCYDGLEAAGPNSNQGAESLLAWLLTWEDLAEQGWL